MLTQHSTRRKLASLKAKKIFKILAATYPAAHCELVFKNPFQLLIATILSAQCTDKLVNSETPALFKRFPDARSLAAADPQVVEQLIKRIGLYRTKARNIVGCARRLQEVF